MSVSIEKNQRTAYVTFERPPLNVLNLALLRELREILDAIQGECEVDLLVLRGGGERAFSAGVDVRDHTRAKVPEMLEIVHGVIRTLFALPQVTVACVRGVCLGGGCELASSCDLVVASTDSSFATPEIHVGCYPPVALARFPSQIGYHRAAEMILTGRQFSAPEAMALGLINRVFPGDQLEHGLETLLDELRGKSGAVLRIALRGLRESSLETFFKALETSERIYLSELLQTEDVEEGVRAFLEKRKPRWNHR